MDKKNRMITFSALAVFIFSTVFFLKVNTSSALEAAVIDETELGMMCINQVITTAKEDEEHELDEEIQDDKETSENEQSVKKSDKKAEKDKAESDEAVPVSEDPLVIIYHTHSTESYMPYSESNYHREAEEGTVRDVGTVLEEELEKRGIKVIHDKTVHDRPSYNESYGRSLNTIQSLMKKYPTADYVIDLHRDAAASSAQEGKYIKIDGKRVAKFSLVVGRGNENYVELYAFAKKVSQASESVHDGFGGAIIEKEYRYNGFVSNKAILLEVGNNKNTIEEARAPASYFAEAMANVIKGEKQ